MSKREISKNNNYHLRQSCRWQILGKEELSTFIGGGLGSEAGRFLGGLYATVLTNDTRVIEEAGAFGEYFGQFTPLDLIESKK